MTGAELEALLAGIRKSWENAAKRKAARQRWWELKETARLRRWLAGTGGGKRGRKTRSRKGTAD